MSDCLAFFFAYGYSIMMSLRRVCLKYCLLGDSLVRCSAAYCSIGLSVYVLRPCETWQLKNSWVCLPTSSRCVGGLLSKNQSSCRMTIPRNSPKHIGYARNLIVFTCTGK